MLDLIAPGVVALFAKFLSGQLNDASRVIVLTSWFVENAPMESGGSDGNDVVQKTCCVERGWPVDK